MKVQFVNNFRVRVLVRVCAVILLLVGASAFGGTIYVKEGASGAGSSWADAYGSLQDALDDASSGDEIWVAAGTYKSSVEVGGTGDRYKTFQLINGVAIYGGFPTGGDTFANRNPNQYETILSGDIGVLGEISDNCYHIFYHPDGLALDPNAILDGFTVTAANADGPGAYPFPHVKGGGMSNWESSPTVTNCKFIGNSAGQGGGIWNNNSSPTVTNCTFTDNSVSNDGGGMYNEWNSEPTLINCKFIGNSAGYGGGINNFSASFSTLIDCIFISNSAIWYGGGVNSYPNNPSSFPIINFNCIFIGNTAGERGGATFEGHCSHPTYVNCTFYGNSAGSLGGAIDATYSGQSILSLVNCILWDNNAEEGSQIACDSTFTVSYCDVQGGWLDIYGGGGTELIWGTGNIGEDLVNDNPLFVDADNGDYHLQSAAGRWDPVSESWVIDAATSPCIDAGNPGCPLGDEFANPNNIRINMGAYGGTTEASKSPANWASLADLTNDHKVDVSDLTVFVQYWLESGQCIPSNLNRNDPVDLLDFGLFANEWLWEK